jgi:hypothetical protein
MKRLLDRLMALERRRDSRETLLIITIQGGLDGGEPVFASADDFRWDREPGESLAAFRARVEEDAQASKYEFVVFGGLPECSGVA